MKITGSAKWRSVMLCALVALLPSAVVGQGSPQLTAFTLTPNAIDTSAASATVSLSLGAKDSAGLISYAEISFADPFGTPLQRASIVVPPSQNVSLNRAVTFPRFSTPGTWTVAAVFLSDTLGNTTALRTIDLSNAGFPTTLTISSSTDSTPPTLTAFGLSTTSINTTASAANLSVSFSASDNLAGTNAFQVTMLSPSGSLSRSATVSLAPALSVTGSAILNFPKLTEAGVWSVQSVYLSDAAGNTLVLDTKALTGRGFPTAVTVTSAHDTTPPVLKSLAFSSPVNIGAGSATSNLVFQVSDDLSGVTSVQCAFTSPSGAETANAAATFAASTLAVGSAALTIPNGSETGTWTLTTLFLEDEAGNTKVMSVGDLIAGGFPTQLVVNATLDTTAPVIVPTILPAPATNGWNTTIPVNLTWSVNDPETGIASSTGCGPVTFTAETPGATVTCHATNGAGLQNSVTVVVRIDTTAPVITPVITPAPNSAGWNNSNVTVSWNVVDPISGVASSRCPTTVVSAETSGTTLNCIATNGAGLVQSASVTVKVDHSAPTVSGIPLPGTCVLWPPNGKMVTVATVTASDSLSGLVPGSFTVTGTSSEPQDPHNPDVVITRNASGAYVVQLRADRLGTGPGRIYTLNAKAADVAGNVANVTATCTVPHDQGTPALPLP